MKCIYKIELVDGNPVILHGEKRYLVDTGSPITFGNEDIVDFCGRNWSTKDSVMGCGINGIADMVGAPLDAIIGLDVMSNFVISFDYRNSVVIFSDEAEDGLSYIPMSISQDSGVSVEIEIDGQKGKCIIDSGARLSYIIGNVPQNAKVVGHQTDYHPLARSFETDVYEAEAILGGCTFTMRFGKLPQMIEMVLSMMQARVVIGRDLLSQYRVVLDFPHSRMALAV